MKPLVSIIIPTYNRVDLIRETLDSLLKQSYPNWEAIVIDDNSTDNTIEAVELMASKDTRITFTVKGENIIKGAPSSRNIGIDKSNGDYIVFLDSDDILAGFCLERRVNVLLENPDIDFAVFQGFFFQENPGDSNIIWNQFTKEEDLDRFLRGDVSWSMTGPIWKKYFLVNNYIRFNENFQSGQDWELHIKALIHKPIYKKIRASPDYFVRRDAKSTRISGSHHTVDKLKNRVNNINSLIDIIPLDKRDLLKVQIVRETIFALVSNPDIEIVNSFLKVSLYKNNTEKKVWYVFFWLIVRIKRADCTIFYRSMFRLFNLLQPKYLKSYKSNYRSEYIDH